MDSLMMSLTVSQFVGLFIGLLFCGSIIWLAIRTFWEYAVDLILWEKIEKREKSAD